MANMAKIIVTHDGTFHTDDIFAVATLELYLGNGEVKVVRTRDPALFETADYCVDVGGQYESKTRRFDHHQSGGAGKRANGIPYASFGLVWKEYGEVISKSKAVALAIDERLVQPVDAVDNGVNIIKPLYEGVAPYTISDFLMSFKKPDVNSNEELYQTFIELVTLAKGLLNREIENEKISESLRNEVKEAYDKSDRKDIIVLEKPNSRHNCRDVLTKYKEPMYVVYQGLDSNDRSWKIEAVPLAKDNFESRKRFPKSWAGKLGADLAEITGVSDAMFSHNSGFLTVVGSKESAIKIAEIALKS
jgi:uncharacterized UPF0160 family protein